MATEFFTVASIVPRNVTTKFGAKTAYDIMAANGVKYGAGFKVPTVKPGDNVQAEVVHGKYGPDIQQIMVVSVSPAPATGYIGSPPMALNPYATAAQQGAANVAYAPNPVFTPTPPAPRFPHEFAHGSHEFPLPQTHGDRTFVRQHALDKALGLVNGNKSVTGVNDNVSAGEVIEIARQFEAYIAGDDDLLAAEEVGEQAVAVEVVQAARAITPAEAIKAARAAVQARS